MNMNNRSGGATKRIIGKHESVGIISSVPALVCRWLTQTVFVQAIVIQAIFVQVAAQVLAAQVLAAQVLAAEVLAAEVLAAQVLPAEVLVAQVPVCLFAVDRDAVESAPARQRIAVDLPLVAESRGLREVLKLDGIFRSQAKVQAGSLNEISGMAASQFHTDHVWVHNDSGGEAELYLLGPAGKVAVTAKLTGTKNRDWEDLASFSQDGHHYLVVGDVGDNAEKQATVRLWIVQEQDWLSEGKAKVNVKPGCEIEVTYPEGAQDCESVAVVGNRLYLVTKISSKRSKQFPSLTESTIYKVEFDLNREKQKIDAVKIGTCPLGLATAMAFSPDGRFLVIRDYTQVVAYDRAESQTWDQRLAEEPSSRFPAPFQRQAEAICFSVNGMELWTISEGAKQSWWKANLRKVAQ